MQKTCPKCGEGPGSRSGKATAGASERAEWAREDAPCEPAYRPAAQWRPTPRGSKEGGWGRLNRGAVSGTAGDRGAVRGWSVKKKKKKRDVLVSVRQLV